MQIDEIFFAVRLTIWRILHHSVTARIRGTMAQSILYLNIYLVLITRISKLDIVPLIKKQNKMCLKYNDDNIVLSQKNDFF